MYQSKLRRFKNINIFTPEEKVLIEKFIKFDEECFHRINLNNQEIYWKFAWKIKINYLQDVNNLLEFICNLFIAFNNHKNVFIEKKFKFYKFIDFFFDWYKIYIFYGSYYDKRFLSLHNELKSIYNNKPEDFLQFIKKINEITEKIFLKNTKNFKKINYKIKRI